MAKVKETIRIECRNPDEYYELMQNYIVNGYKIEEDEDNESLNFTTLREHKMWELEW